MSAFEKASLVEELARKEILPYLIATCDKVDDTDRCLFLQKTVGDFMATKNGQQYGIELKAEESNKYDNFFLETWSNKKYRTPGWMVTCQADYLFYYFVAERRLYILNFKKITKWAFGFVDEESNAVDGQIYKYPEKPQKKYDQLNDTWGRCVPIEDLLKGISPAWKLLTAADMEPAINSMQREAA